VGVGNLAILMRKRVAAVSVGRIVASKFSARMERVVFRADPPTAVDCRAF
jgi:hypothetical protein